MSLILILNRKCQNNLCQVRDCIKIGHGPNWGIKGLRNSGIEEKQTVKILFGGRAYDFRILENGWRERRQRFG
jgi:hypothetical protein